MKSNITSVLILICLIFSCNTEPSITYKYADEKNLFSCPSTDMTLIKEAVYAFENFIFEYYAFGAPEKEKAAYFNYLKNTEAKLLPIGERFDDHLKNVFYALKNDNSLWSGPDDHKSLNLDHAIVQCITDNIDIEAVKPVFKALAESKTLRGEILAPTLRSYFNRIQSDRALATYVALDLFYAKIFQFDLSLPPTEMAKQIREINDKNVEHLH